MDRIRAITAGLLITWLAGVALTALYRLLTAAAPAGASLGLLLSAISPLAWLVLVPLRSQKRALHPLGFTVACALGLAICMAISWRHGPAAGHAHLLAGSNLIAWVAFVRWVHNPGAQVPSSGA